MLADPTGQTLAYAQSLKSTLGCDSNGGGSSDRDYSKNNNPLSPFGDLVDKFLLLNKVKVALTKIHLKT